MQERLATLVSDDELIDLIYACLLGEASWKTFLHRLSVGIPDGLTAIFSQDTTGEEAFVGLIAGREDNVWLTYENHFASRNPWMPACALQPIGQGVAGDDFFPFEQLVRTEYYNDFLLQIGVRTSMGVTIVRDNERSLMVTALTNSEDPQVNRLVSDRFTRLAPHLRRAAEFYRNNPLLPAASELGGNMLDALDVGMVVIGQGRRPKSFSRRGKELLSSGLIVKVSPVGRIIIGDERAQATLCAMLEYKYEGAGSIGFAMDETRLTLIRVSADRFSLFFEGPTVILLLEARNHARRTFDRAMFVHSFGLSSGEERALSGIIAGRSVDEMAEDASRSRETIRSQIKSLYAKMGVHSEAELLRLVFLGRCAN